VAVSIVSLLVLAFILLYSLESYIYSVSPEAKASAEFDKTILTDNHRKIFVLGSSYVGRINASLLQEYLDAHGEHGYSVYNLARSNDLPKARLKEIDKIISMKPDLVVYGVGFRDFEKQTQNRPQNILPNIQEELTKHLSLDQFVGYLNQHGLGNPQVATLKLFQMTYGGLERAYKQDTPFYPAHSTDGFYRKIRTDSQLQKDLLKTESFRGVGDAENIDALKEIIKRFQDNKIKFILFSTPYSKYYLNTIPSTEKHNFLSLFEGFHEKFGVPTYVMLDKYSSYKIWTDNTHVSLSSAGNLYTYDIGKMVTKEIQSAF
jgi:hypothetical protein